MLSDIMLSQPSHLERSSELSYPLSSQELLSDPNFKRVSGPYVPAGYAQKTVCFARNCLALWSGSELVARAIIRELDATYNPATGIDLRHVVATCGISQAEAQSVSMIVYLDTGHTIVRQAIGMSVQESIDLRILYAGSGSFSVVEDIIDQSGKVGVASFYENFFLRLGSTILHDVLDHNGAFNFGGWFEITESRMANFFKIPYAVKIWHIDGDQVVDGPAFVSGYSGHDLLIFSLDKRISKALSPYFVPDFLGRSDGAWGFRAPDAPHEIEVHVIHVRDTKQTLVTTLLPPDTTISLKVTDHSCEWSMDPTFFKHVISNFRAGNIEGQKIRRGSDWLP